MSLDGLLASSPQKEKAVVQLVTEEEKDHEGGHQTNLPTVFSQDINDNETPYEVKLVYLVEKGYTRDQAEELIRTTSSPNAKARHDHQNVVHHQSQQHLSATDVCNFYLWLAFLFSLANFSVYFRTKTHDLSLQNIHIKEAPHIRLIHIIINNNN
jgi:hypothetical protein